jgi:hypothetical protein
VLTPLDRYAFQWVIQGTWVFASRLDIDVLKQGLARLLASYPLLGGRVVAGQRIEGSAKGIPVIHDSDETVGAADFHPGRVDAARFACEIHPRRVRAGAAPLLTLKLTQLREGCVLAICCSHACLDGHSFYQMARNLSLAATGAAVAPPPCERRSDDTRLRQRAQVARDARQAGWHRITALDALSYAAAQSRWRDRAFVARFPPPVLQRCRDALARSSACTGLSINSALIAHLAYCVARLVGLAGRDSFSVSVAVDQRERVRALARDFAGNAVSVVATAPIPAESGREDIAARLHERLAPLLTKPSPPLESIARLTADIVFYRLPYSPVAGLRLLGRRRLLFYTNSFARFPVYDLDFGSGSRPVRPIRAIPHNLGDPILVWPAPPPAGGLELYFSGWLARAVRRLAGDDPWWMELRRYGA